MRVVVLWEDELSPDTSLKGYGPHVLALQCAVDASPSLVERRALGVRVTANPRKGIDKLLLFAATLDAPRVIAVCDDDKLRAHLKLSHEASDVSVVEELKKKSPETRWILLHRNMEDVLAAAAAALGEAVPTGKAKPRERDRVLHRLADASPDRRRDFLLRIPSFAAVVAAIIEALR